MCICQRKVTHTLVHPEDRGEGFFGVIQGSVTIIKDTNTIPQLRVILQIFYKTRSDEDGFN